MKANVAPIPHDESGGVIDFRIQRVDAKRIGSAADEVAAKYERIAKAHEANRKRLEERRQAEERQFQTEMRMPLPPADIELTKVRSGDVMLDRRYQTNERFDAGRAKKMARSYDQHLCRPIDVNIRPGDPTETIWCFDGQHRVAATVWRLGPEFLMDARLHRISYQEEAELFARQHDNVKAIPFALRFNAEIEAGNAEALEAKALADRLGLTLGRKAKNWTIGTTTFLDCCRMYGLEATEEGIGYLLERWKGAHQSLEEHIAKGFVLFVLRRKDDPNYEPRKIRQRLTETDLKDLERHAADYPALTKAQGIAAAFVEKYNGNRRNRLPDWKPRGEK